MTSNNHHDQLDRRLDQAHRVFMEDHNALRQDLLDRLDEAPATLPAGAIFLRTSTKRKWIMRSSLAVAAAILIAAGVILFSSGPGSPTVAWAGVRENVENATAMHWRNRIVVLDAEGKTAREFNQTEVWTTDDGRNRMVSYDDQGRPKHANIVGHDGALTLSYTTRHAILSTSDRPAAGPRDEEAPVDSADRGGPLEMLLRVTDEIASPAGEEELAGRPAVKFTIQMQDLIAFTLREQGIDDPAQMKVEAAFGGSAEELAKLPPIAVWVDRDTGLPLRAEMPMSPKMAEMMRIDLPEGGRLVARMDYLGWNEQVDESAFDLTVPEGWALDRNHAVYLGDQTDLTPDDPERVTAGIPLADGVSFRLFDDKGELVATEADVLGVTELDRRSGRGHGVEQDQWDKRSAKLRFTDEVARRIDEAPTDERGVRWTYQLGDAIRGEVQVMHVWRGTAQSGLGHGGELESIDIGELGFDQFVERYLASE